MGKDNVFDRLVKDLSDGERLKILEKIEENVRISQDPMEFNVENGPVKSLDQEYNELSWLDKLVIFIKTLFLGKEKSELTKNYLVRRIQRKIQYMNSQYFNMKTESATKEFYEVLSDISKSVEFIKQPLADCFNIDKESFYILLGKLEFPAVYEELLGVADPWEISRINPSLETPQIRKILYGKMEETIARLSPEDRVRMMETTGILYHMYQLSSFPYSKILGHFPVNQNGEVLPASFSVLEKSLEELGSVLNSFLTPPGQKLIEAVFLTEYANLKQSELVLEEYLRSSMGKTEHLMSRIREFNRNIPILDVLRIVKKDPFYLPEDIGGGEDWFYFYNIYWQNKAADRMKVFSRSRTIEENKNELVRRWEISEISILNNYNTGRPFCYFSTTMALLKTFYKEIIQKKMFYPMKIIHVDGEFYKKNNRAEFDESFENLMKIGEKIKWFERYLEPDGEGGMKIRDAIHNSGGNRDAEQELLEPVFKVINRESLNLLENSLNTLFSVGKLLNGILLGNGGTYDTLANFSDLGGRKNAELRDSVQEAADHVNKFSHTLQDILNLEKEAAREEEAQAF